MSDVSAAADDASRDAAIAAGLAERGWAMCPGFLPDALVQALAESAHAASAAGRFRAAAIGAGARRQTRSDVRTDRICWLEMPPRSEVRATAAEVTLFQRLEQLRGAVNRELQLGLFDLECHYALYAPGGRYARHLDRFANDSRRTLSCVLYLNQAWSPAHGGELRLHLEHGRVVDVLPEGGTLAVFLSDRIEHEVLPAARERLSIAGWFRRRGALPS